MSTITSVIYLLPKSNYFSEGARGRVTHAIGVANGLSRNGLHVTVVSGPGLSQIGSELEERVERFEVPKTPRINSLLWELKWQMGLFLRMKRLLMQDKDSAIIMRYSPSTTFLQFLLAKGPLAGRLFAAEVNSLAFHHLKRLPQTARHIVRRAECRFLRLYDEIHVVSKRLTEDLSNTLAQKPVTVVPNASDSRESLVRERDDMSQTLRLIYLGQYHDYYDFEFFVTAFRRVTEDEVNAELHFWGNGVLRKSVSVNGSLKSRIYFHGQYALEDLEGQFDRRQDVFILPSRPGSRAEITSPVKLFEYMSLGIPIVAAHLGQIPEILQDRVTGYLYDPLDNESLQNVLRHVAENREERISVGKRAMQDLKAHHTWEKRMEFLVHQLDLIKQGHYPPTGATR